MHRKRLCLLALLALLPLQASDFSIRINRIDAMAAAEWGRDRIGSLTIGVIEGGKLIWTRSYGEADMQRHIAANRDTAYRIGSITKQFTAVMLSQLVERGKVHLSDPVRRYVPEIRRVQGGYAGAAPITLFELATHTAGLAREPDDAEAYLKGPVAQWDKLTVDALSHTRFVFEPGIQYAYSNVDYAVLGLALERAAGQSYVEYMQANILRPLGLEHTAFEPNLAIRGHIATGYAVGKGRPDSTIPERELYGRGYKVPGGGLFSTVEDLARFAAIWFGTVPETVLQKHTLDEIFAQVVAADARLTRGYGRGFMVWRRGDVIAFGHGGSVAGYLSALYLDRASRSGVIVLANENGGQAKPSSLAMRVLQMLASG